MSCAAEGGGKPLDALAPACKPPDAPTPLPSLDRALAPGAKWPEWLPMLAAMPVQCHDGKDPSRFLEIRVCVSEKGEGAVSHL